jgi:hypothetical protein
VNVASKTRTKGHASIFTADAYDKDTYCPPPLTKKVPYLANVRDVTVTRPLQYLLNVSGGLIAKISDNKIAIKGK